ncbi:MAG: hypothetical protein ACI8TE_001255 [Francisella sp.]|jgi:hypothetical protein
MSRLDLLKQGSTAKKTTSTKPNGRGGMMGEKTKKSQAREDDFENELDDAPTSTAAEYDPNDDEDERDDTDVNVIELDIDLNSEKDLKIDASLMSDDDEESEADDSSADIESDLPIDKDVKSTIVEAGLGVDYSEEDIKLEMEYSFDQRDELYNIHVKVIKDGGLEVAASKILHLENIIRISVTLSELKEQVGCEARVVSVFPRNIRAAENNEDPYRYIVQFIGPNATETERVFSKYLLGYKPK